MQPHEEAAQEVDPTRHDLIGPTMPFLTDPLGKGKPPHFDWFIKNSAPHALRVIGTSSTAHMRPPDNVDFAEELERLLKVAPFQELNTDLTPGDTFGFSIKSDTILGPEAYQALIAGTQVLYVVGAVLYEDSHRGLRGSTFCYFYDVEHNRFLTAAPNLNRIGFRESWDRIKIPRRPTLKVVDQKMLRFVEAELILFSLSVQNTGGLSAKLSRAVIDANFAFASEINDEKLGQMLEGLKNESGLPSIKEVPGLCVVTFTPELSRIAKKEFLDAVADGSKVFYLCGRMDYTDKDGGSYWTQYCYTYDGSKWRPYEKFNQQGRN